jgi:hypothetical protein
MASDLNETERLKRADRARDAVASNAPLLEVSICYGQFAILGTAMVHMLKLNPIERSAF